ncbi:MULTISPECIES: F0F1 ATP synthase subunit epsilon [unclassified Paracoccus (in: a-proteobacteria)]|uniref:F0F1 ATP synthase subunit epsilon n=1 Tax=unclassified Paracoccus (in: a-proteobacteria) TaxID=2688777 RepID=UPI0012B28E21|nr:MULTISPECIES: F0F1 ATP synthase subunit epsilon [unclassified Paracoccus (in: a-proteobacteria)]UXU74800.1 F0F1 ATP synthase subunit epsilon [Paracoccus sp. SMMA_5]UXU80697.1 F0F1 ATP synthase subunit epsilon [Paracoccus sp. SMMA_5_TC]
MADTMQFDLVSPERNLVSVPVREVRLPGAEGDLTAMPGHAPAIVNLRPGLVTVIAADGSETQFAVTGGFAEINNESVSLLAERGHPRAEMTQEVFNEMMAQAHRRVQAAKERESAGEEIVAAAVKLLADMEALGTHIGLDPNHANFPH